MMKIFDRKLFTVTTSIGSINLFAVAIPLLIEHILYNLLGTMNTIILNGYSADAVVSVSTANSMISMINSFFSVITMGATVVISNYIGAEKLEQVKEVIFVTVFSYVVIAGGCSLVFNNFGYELVSLLNITGEILEEAVKYFRIRMMFLAVNAFYSSLSAILRCYGYALPSVICGLLMNFMNVILSIYVIYYPEAPVTGVSGVAWACAVSNVVGCALMLMVFLHKRIPWKKTKYIRDFFIYLKKILKIGVPTGLSSSSFMMSQTVVTSFVALIGTHALNAKIYLANIVAYVYLCSVSLGSANAMLVGRLYGAGDIETADQANKQLVKITLTVNFVLSMLVWILRIPLMSIFTEDKEILRIAGTVLLIDLVVEMARAVSHVYEYALRSIGDVLFNVVVLVISCWTCSIGLAYVLSIPCGLGLAGCWIGLAVDESIRGIVTFFRWRYKKSMILGKKIYGSK